MHPIYLTWADLLVDTDELLLCLPEDLKALGAPETVIIAFEEDIFEECLGEGVSLEAWGGGLEIGEEGELDDDRDEDCDRESVGKIIYLSWETKESLAVFLADASSKCFVPFLAVLSGDDDLNEDDKKDVLEDDGDVDETGMVPEILVLVFSPLRSEVRADTLPRMAVVVLSNR